ncbi:MAG: limonene-1,2-epoxide hydrolase family protein [Myxococcota bacterium]|nr:limonene-1,2-epoxide hydrolase family protein [Myxococcota bacterium]
MSIEANKQVVADLWQAVYRKDWDAVAAAMAPDGHYEDVPAPDAGATGGANVVKRLRVGLDPVVRFEHHAHRIVAEGDTLIFEHTEVWHFETGESIRNDFVTVHEIEDGKIKLWRDYWDIGTLMAQAPAWWIERIGQHDESEWS